MTDHHRQVTDAFTQDVLHRVPEAVTLLVLTQLVLFYIPAPRPLFVDIAAGAILGGTSLFIVCATQHQHTTPMCSRCADRTPRDPLWAARRERALLWICHRSVPGFWATVFAAEYLLARYCGLPRHAVLTVGAVVTARMYGYWRHNQLRPWCPYCRGGRDDGDTDEVVDPTPDPRFAALH